jgi:hypothetical protein
MKIARNIARYMFAPMLALIGLIHASYGQNISLGPNASIDDETGGDQRGEYSAVVERRDIGIKEVIADEYKRRYQDWKSEFLSTEIGRKQWEFYSRHPRFVLTITVSQDVLNGARTNQYRWSESGELISATITLGSQIDKGFPDPVYYPVLNALKPKGSMQPVMGKVVAAAKIAHEFGHLNRAVSADGALYRLQYCLIPVYNSILQNNGFNTKDPRVIEVARKIGGTPVEINEDGEYWGEANAMLYLHERITKESYRRWFVARIKENVEQYANTCRERFLSLLNRNEIISCRNR